MSRRIFVVIGAKGGCGATTLAFELAKRFASPGRCALVDADFAGRRSHAVSLDAIERLDASRAPGSPAVAKSGPYDLVELTNSYEDGFIVKRESVEAVLDGLSPDATVVVDASQPFASAVRPFVTRALRFIVVVEPTLLGVSAARQLLAAMARFDIPPGRIALVINSRDGNYEIKRNEITDALDFVVVADIPPSRDRSYAKVLATLAGDLQKLPHLEAITDMRLSASIPVGDRRSVSRNGVYGASDTAAVTPIAAARSSTVGLLDPSVVTRENIKSELHAAMLARIDFAAAARMTTDAAKMAELRGQVNDLATELVAARRDLGSIEEAARIKREIIEEALGLGPIESFMHDPSVTEIMVNGAREVFVERFGKIEMTAKRFANDRQVRLVMERVLAPLGRRIDESSPMVDARLPDGSRVNATIPPFSIDGPTLTIRRFGSRRLGIDDLLANGAVTQPIVAFLNACVHARLNVVISGGTGSGKTTLLNALSSFIPRDERIVTIEDAAELMLEQPHVVRLESRPPNLEGRGSITIRDCVRNSLRMRPDRIVVGECRGAEALDMLQAMNTGHDGSLTTIHANTSRDALSRIETMVLMAGYDLPIRAIREQVSSAIDIVVQIARLSDGSRRLTCVSEVVGMEGDVVTMQDIVRYRQRGIDKARAVLGSFEYTGVQPACLRRFSEMGVPFDVGSIASPAQAAQTGELAWSAR